MAKETNGQSQNKPPVAPKGKRAVWHKEYSYKNQKGTIITIRGHWELIDLVVKKEKPKAEPKAEAPEEKPENGS